MTNKQTLLDLAKRCEEAEGSCRELDANIFMAISMDCQYEYPCRDGYPNAGKGWVYKYTATKLSKGELQTEYLSPRYTLSIDAAMRIVPEGWHIDRLTESGVTRCFLLQSDSLASQHTKGGSGNFIATAILSAALTARAIEMDDAL